MGSAGRRGDRRSRGAARTGEFRGQQPRLLDFRFVRLPAGTQHLARRAASRADCEAGRTSGVSRCCCTRRRGPTRPAPASAPAPRPHQAPPLSRPRSGAGSPATRRAARRADQHRRPPATESNSRAGNGDDRSASSSRPIARPSRSRAAAPEQTRGRRHGRCPLPMPRARCRAPARDRAGLSPPVAQEPQRKRTANQPDRRTQQARAGSAARQRHLCRITVMIHMCNRSILRQRSRADACGTDSSRRLPDWAWPPNSSRRMPAAAASTCCVLSPSSPGRPWHGPPRHYRESGGAARLAASRSQPGRQRVHLQLQRVPRLGVRAALVADVRGLVIGDEDARWAGVEPVDSAANNVPAEPERERPLDRDRRPPAGEQLLRPEAAQ